MKEIPNATTERELKEEIECVNIENINPIGEIDVEKNETKNNQIKEFNSPDS